MRRSGVFKALAAASLVLGFSAAHASTTIGGYTFPDDAFVDTLLSSTGSYSTSGGSVGSVLTDTDAATWAYSYDAGASVTLAWSSVVAVNGPGADIVLFELGVPDAWNVTINGVTNYALSAATGESAGGFSLNAAAIDLSDFGVAAGGSVSQLYLTFQSGPNTSTITSTSLVGALDVGGGTPPVPELSTWMMLALGFAGVGYAGLRSSRRQARSVA